MSNGTEYWNLAALIWNARRIGKELGMGYADMSVLYGLVSVWTPSRLTTC